MKLFILVLAIFIIAVAGIIKSFMLKGTVAGIDTKNENQLIRGLILPHHDLARELFIKSLEKIKKDQQFEVIVVLSPNHFYPESYAFSSSMSLKDFPLARNYLEEMRIYDPNIIFDTELVENEHGITIPLTYLKHYFPKAKFLPIIFSPRYSQEKLLSLARWMSKRLPSNTLYVAAVDFSHENMVEKALNYNKESITTIKLFDYPTLFSYEKDNNSHMDSPSSIATLMMIMEQLGSKNWETWYSSHGSLLTNDPVLQGTSYVIGVFR